MGGRQRADCRRRAPSIRDLAVGGNKTGGRGLGTQVAASRTRLVCRTAGEPKGAPPRPPPSSFLHPIPSMHPPSIHLSHLALRSACFTHSRGPDNGRCDESFQKPVRLRPRPTMDQNGTPTPTPMPRPRGRRVALMHGIPRRMTCQPIRAFFFFFSLDTIVACSLPWGTTTSFQPEARR